LPIFKTFAPKYREELKPFYTQRKNPPPQEKFAMRSVWPRLLQLAILSAIIIGIASATTNLTIHFLDVGQGDAELIQFDGKNVLVDGGEQDMGPRVESYLQDHSVSSLDLLVATHPHDDHIGGLLTILNDVPVMQVLDSGQVHTTSTFEDFLNLIDQKNIPYTAAERGQTVNLDPRLKIEVLSPPATLFSDDLNQNSVVLKVTYNKVSFMLMGDAGIEAESSLLSSGYNLTSDVLKVGHHGSSSSSSVAFLNAVKPAISVIEVGAGNSYGHPTQKTLSFLQRVGSEVYRTDLNGNIVVTTDGQSYSVSTEKLSRDTATVPKSTAPSFVGSSVGPPASASALSQQQFVGSSKSDKYHYPSCSAAKKIKPANLVTFSSSEDARAHGYVPCGICHPP
jgi:beta-lactamase superfamily II metal-dependent hydrolase